MQAVARAGPAYLAEPASVPLPIGTGLAGAASLSCAVLASGCALTERGVPVASTKGGGASAAIGPSLSTRPACARVGVSHKQV